ncbi:MAG: 3-hydroxyacyl-CoA dehydrogenase NAD-binding domain-containing protein [Candidatus Dechloromonas phosphoritropha]
MRAQLAKMVEKGRLSAADAAAAGMRLIPAHEIADLAAAGLVVEAIVEDLAEKRALFADLEDIVGRDCILCTNTLSISVTAIGAALRHPERLAGLHFFNPAPLMVLIKVISPVSPPTRRLPRHCSPPPPPGARPRSMPSRRQSSSSIASPAPTTPRRCAWRRRVPPTAQPLMPLCARPAASAWGRSS